MNTSSRLASVLLLVLAGCGDGEPSADPYACMAAGGAACFQLPASTIAAADALGKPAQAALHCSPYEVHTSVAPVTFSGRTVNSFERTMTPLVHVEAFADLGLTSLLGETISDEVGAYELTIGTMPSQLFVRTTATGALPMHLLYQRTDPAVTQHAMFELATASRDDVATSLALVGDRFAIGKSQVTGIAYDCDGNRLVNVIANLAPESAAIGHRTFEPDVRTYYIADRASPALARRVDLAQTTIAGSFTATNVAPGRHFVQLWGFVSESAVADGADGLTLLGEAELAVPATETGLLVAVHARVP
jgi:hypothetical protein